MLTTLDLVLLVLWCTCFVFNEYVLLIGMVLLNVHKAFQSKLHTFMNCPNMYYWLVWSYWICIKLFKVNCVPLWIVPFLSMISWYVCIWSPTWYKWCTNPIFSLFPNILCSGRWRALGRLLRRLGILNHTSWVGPHSLRAMSISILLSYSSFKTLLFFPFLWILNIVWPICGLVILMYGLGPSYYTLVRWLWDETSIWDYVIFYISLCNKSRRLSNLTIRRVYVYSI